MTALRTCILCFFEESMNSTMFYPSEVFVPRDNSIRSSYRRLWSCGTPKTTPILNLITRGEELEMNSVRTKSEIEGAIRIAIIKFEQEFMGRGPDDVRTFVVRDLVVVRLKGVLTPAERQLAKTVEGVDMVKQLRQNLIALGRDKLCEQVSEITGAKTLALFTDIDVQLGERVFVFTADRDIQTNER